ncbi:MAG: PIN domain-containing protein [Blastocatellia bacterium]|nr:PIN domain-containing protein [Blastocatellia bacterium]
MRNKALDALAYSYSPSDKVLFDANILVSLFSGLEPPGSIPVRKYSQVLQRISKAGARMLLDVLVLSEFMNVCVRKQHSLAMETGGVWTSFKNYRQSADFPAVAGAVAQAARQIVKLMSRIDHPFTQWPIETILDEFATGQRDFNDQLLVELARREGALLLTNDLDFVTGGITVLTTHPRLLAACP